MSNMQKEVFSHSIFSWLLGGLALSLGVSKAGLSIFTILLLLVFIGFSVKYRAELRFHSMSRLSQWLLLLFASGSLLSLLSSGGLGSMKDFMNKGSLLLVLPICLHLLHDEKNRRFAFFSLLLGAVIASLYSLSMWAETLTSTEPTDRIASFWDLGRWGEYVCYVLVFLLPLLSMPQSRKQRSAIILCFSLVLLALLISGMRGPFLAIVVSFLVYFLILNRRYLLHFAVLSILGTAVVFIATPSVIEFAWLRFISIFDVTQNYSNLARLNMWFYAVDFFMHNLTNDVQGLLWGSGFGNLGPIFGSYMEQSNQLDTLIQVTGGAASINDHHNAALNVVNQIGVVYTLLLGVGVIMVLKRLWGRYRITPASHWLHSAILVVLAYLVMGIFYSNELNYQTLMAAFMCCLAVRFHDTENTLCIRNTDGLGSGDA
ncbi:O-antigen ligase family protein [Vibrio nomapromontoriensis]|uniref:O-antigen ligase family protein n=1 Tax=Vibrio nomapromontoriensis TaxID=2910246 RepID=UPI003D1009AE